MYTTTLHRREICEKCANDEREAFPYGEFGYTFLCNGCWEAMTITYTQRSPANQRGTNKGT